jgi:hypothetical protein
MSDVFISYSKTDRHQAEALADDLKLHGYSVWWDTELYGGEDFHDVILKALDAAKVAIVIWSEASVKSQWVRGEAQHAQSQQKLIPTKFAKLRDADVPLNFRALHTELLDDRERILRAVERLTGKTSGATSSAGGAGAPTAPTRRTALASDRTLQQDRGMSAWQSPRRWAIFWVALVTLGVLFVIWNYLAGLKGGLLLGSWTPLLSTLVGLFAFIMVERLTRRR